MADPTDNSKGRKAWEDFGISLASGLLGGIFHFLLTKSEEPFWTHCLNGLLGALVGFWLMNPPDRARLATICLLFGLFGSTVLDVAQARIGEAIAKEKLTTSRNLGIKGIDEGVKAIDDAERYAELLKQFAADNPKIKVPEAIAKPPANHFKGQREVLQLIRAQLEGLQETKGKK